MRAIHHLFFAVLLACFCACGNKPYPRIMQTADSLVNTYPDSALALLEQLKGSIEREPEATRMYYQLLAIKAKDKAYITHTSDSLIKKVVSYYQKTNDENYLLEAYYFAGRTYHDLNDAPQALDCYQKAAGKITANTSQQFTYLIHYQIGMLYL